MHLDTEKAVTALMTVAIAGVGPACIQYTRHSRHHQRIPSRWPVRFDAFTPRESEQITATAGEPEWINMYTPPPETRVTRNSHIIVAGTGRTGTTFLVQYLTELGLDTHISRHGPGQFDATAQAGFEDMPLLTAAEALPYVIKAPWMGQYIDEILASSDIQIDAAILPVLNPVEAAASRTILELRAMHQSAPDMAQLTETWENWALTPGGTIFSLNPLDQARILAIGFHRLVQRLVDAEF